MGGRDRWPDPDQCGIPCCAHHTQFKAGGSRGSHSLHPCPTSAEDPARCSACNLDPDSDPCIPESSSCLLPRPVRDFLVLPGRCWQDASAPAPNSEKLSIGFVYFVLFLLLLILLILLVSLVKLLILSFSPFSSFFPSSGGRMGVNREHLPLSLLPPCSKEWQVSIGHYLKTL